MHYVNESNRFVYVWEGPEHTFTWNNAVMDLVVAGSDVWVYAVNLLVSQKGNARPGKWRCCPSPDGRIELGKCCLPGLWACFPPPDHPSYEVLKPPTEQENTFLLLWDVIPSPTGISCYHIYILLFFLISLSTFMNRSQIFSMNLESGILFLSFYFQRESNILKSNFLVICEYTKIFILKLNFH